MQVNGEGDYPFVIRAIDGGRAGLRPRPHRDRGQHRRRAEGRPATASDDTFTYEAAGNLVAGDFQWIIADIARWRRHRNR